MQKIYGIGETVYDIIFRQKQPQRAVPGGSTFNSMISLGRCGLHPTMITEIGDDQVGKIVFQFMQDNNVDTNFISINSGRKTAVSLAFLNDIDEASYQFYKDLTSISSELHYPKFNAGDVVLFGSYYAVNPAKREYTYNFLKRAQEAGCILYYDVNFRPAHAGDIPHVLENIYDNMRLATIVRGSTEDFDCLFGCSDPERIYREHIAPLCPNFICTSGANGIHAYWGHNFHRLYPIKAVNTVSTIGAGDNFNAGFICALCLQNVSQNHIDTTYLNTLVESGISFAAEVCKSYDNYVSHEFATQLVEEYIFKNKLFLFDLDGVIIDTEGQYQKFWHNIGQKYLPEITDFATRIKGTTLDDIFATYFPEDLKVREEILCRLIEYEKSMRYTVFPGALEFVKSAQDKGIPCAIVTSSNHTKMLSLSQQLPALTSHFDHIFTAEDSGRGKPHPDCYINAARHFGTPIKETIVFEDSVNGLKAAQASGSLVIGLSTTHPSSVVSSYADITLPALSALNK